MNDSFNKLFKKLICEAKDYYLDSYGGSSIAKQRKNNAKETKTKFYELIQKSNFKMTGIKYLISNFSRSAFLLYYVYTPEELFTFYEKMCKKYIELITQLKNTEKIIWFSYDIVFESEKISMKSKNAKIIEIKQTNQSPVDYLITAELYKNQEATDILETINISINKTLCGQMFDILQNDEFIQTLNSKYIELQKKQKEEDSINKKTTYETEEVQNFIKKNFDKFKDASWKSLSNPDAIYPTVKLPAELLQEFLTASEEVKEGFLNYLSDYNSSESIHPNVEHYDGSDYYSAKRENELYKNNINKLMYYLIEQNKKAQEK